jgi:hypothetical protein
MKPEPRAKKPKFTLARKDEAMADLVAQTDQTTLAIWAIDCAGRVLYSFEENYPDDPRPRGALNICREWTTSGIFCMKVIRGASLAAHAAARDAGSDTPARSAARAAGQAVATAHVPAHSMGAANYALQAVWRAAGPAGADVAVEKERDWQYRHLLALRGPEIPESR